jgi:hypothetical protein
VRAEQRFTVTADQPPTLVGYLDDDALCGRVGTERDLAVGAVNLNAFCKRFPSAAEDLWIRIDDDAELDRLHDKLVPTVVRLEGGGDSNSSISSATRTRTRF